MMRRLGIWGMAALLLALVVAVLAAWWALRPVALGTWRRC